MIANLLYEVYYFFKCGKTHLLVSAFGTFFYETFSDICVGIGSSSEKKTLISVKNGK